MKEKIRQLIRYEKCKALYLRHERFLMPATLVFGLVVDTITFTTLNIRTALLILTAHLLLAGAAIIFQNTYQAGKIKKKRWSDYLRLFTPLLVQFSFGALLSASFVFYFFSGTVWVSWPFILIIAFLMISNDVFRSQYLRPGVQVTVYFFILLTYFSICLPFIFNSIATGIFILAGLLSLAMIYGYFWLLARFRQELNKYKSRFVIRVLVVFMVVNALYFLNIIPPIPLSIRDVELAHAVQKVGSSYKLQVEKQSLWQRLKTEDVIHKTANGSIAVYMAIFAPEDLHVGIIHHWQRYDSTKKEWVTKDKLLYSVNGGRKDGYRGYSIKSFVPTGEWRVDAETERGQVLGRVNFRVVEADQIPTTEILEK